MARASGSPPESPIVHVVASSLVANGPDHCSIFTLLEA